MGLRVYFEDKNGKTDSITYGCNADNYEKILKVELLEEKEERKTWIGSKFVGVKEIDEKEILKELVVKPSKTDYKFAEYTKDDTDKVWYYVSTLCVNCNQSQQIAIKKGQKVDKNKIKQMTCRRCKIPKSLRHAVWNGQRYVMSVNKK